MSTKEECLEALNEVAKRLVANSCGGCTCEVHDCINCEIAQPALILEQLINEHFDNPPLKFEELKDVRFVYDIFNDGYYKLVYADSKTKIVILEFNNGGWVETQFEENRFYRYQVKEDE